MGDFLAELSFDEIVRLLEDVEKWFQDMNINFSGSRFDEYKRNITMLTEYQRQGRISEFGKLKRFNEIAFSLSESGELVSIYQQLKDADPRFLRKRLRLVAKGPSMIDQEEPTKSTGQPRDCLFELNMIAFLKARGLEVVLDSYSDVHCLFDSKHVLFECKRPQTRNSVEWNFLKAKKQLTESLNKLNKADSKGIISISIGKIANKGRMFLQSKNKADLRAKVLFELKNFWVDFKYLEKQILDTRIIGVFCHLNGPATIEDKKYIADVQYIRQVSELCLKESADFHFLKRMVAHLG